MEGDPEESDEDAQGEERPVVLWEKSIEQSFFVDLSEDESLHFSDLERSLALHLSQAESAASEASIHLSGGAELSGLDDTSSESSVSNQSGRVVEIRSKGNFLHLHAQRPNTMQDELPINQESEDAGQNTSDEDQEDLPYDGNLGSPYFNQKDSSEGSISSDGGHTVHASPDLSDELELVQEDAYIKRDKVFDASKPSEVGVPCPGAADINQLLLRHFSQEELLRSGRLIEAETLPEVSLLESADDSVFSWAPTRNSKTVNSNHTESSEEKSNAASKKASLEEQTEKMAASFTSAAYANNASNSASTDSDQTSGDFRADEAKQEKENEEEEVQRVPLVRTRSFSEMKYGQGQVHYPLPDFSKVAPKVRIPKAPARSVPQCPSTMHRAQSSPGMLDVISRVLEDSCQPTGKANVFKDNDKHPPPALVHHLQAEYDKLLTKYAEAENLIDQMRIGTNAQPSSEVMLYLEDDDDDDDQGELAEGGHLGYRVPHLPPSENISEKGESAPHRTIKEATTASSSELQDNPSDGERMTAELRDIINQFTQKVDEFRFTVSNLAVSTEEKQKMLRSMMEAQDQLERKYISKKEEHRALEMQNYMGLSRNTGTFDPNRLVEGDIFRIGMHLEDIKEIIDKNMCEQISPPHSTSTPTPVTVPTPVCMSTPSPPPSLHEGQSNKMDPQEEAEGGSEIHVKGGLGQISELITAEHLLKNTGHNCRSRHSPGSLVGLDGRTAEDEEERSSALSEATDHNNLLACLSGNKSISQRQWTASSHSVLDSVFKQNDECDLGDCVSLAVEVSCSAGAPRDSDSHSLSELDLNTSCASQRIVSSETDSGFGSSYLNQSGSGPFQPNLLTESVQSQKEGLSSSDSEDSCSNLQTTIHSAALTGYQQASLHPSVQTQHCGAAAAVKLWVESTAKKPSAMLQGSDQNLPAQHHQHTSQPLLSTTRDTDGRGSPLYSCSCNSEAILALQSEVSRLKKDLEMGLVQLPHLAQKMDYLTSKYREECQEHRSKTRTFQSPACNSVGNSSSRGVSNLSCSEARMEDWISSDMGLSQSKGTGSSETSCSEIMLQLHSSPAGSRKGGRDVPSAPEFQYKVCPAVWTEGSRSVETSGLKNYSLKGEKDRIPDFKQRPKTIAKSLYSKDRWSLLSSPFLHKPLLQVSYGSSCSLPASYKVRETPLQSTSHHRKRSTQSDTALLPSNVYFQRTPSPASVPFKTGSRTSRRSRSKEEDMNKTLDQAIEVARSMKRTTDRMARRLSADLAKAQLHRKLHHMQPLGGRKHQEL
ncbi:uncharacterized protein aknad1 isoform X3 [Archocentrus centrarchus]|nr:protein AKNAD1 isoform X3 [Archocentrus centrarchus]